MSKKPKGRTVTIPIMGPPEHNGMIYTAIGGLVINWANNESVFLAMLQTLISGGKHTATIIWASHRTSRARLELLDKLAREQLQSAPALIADVQAAIKRFKGLSSLRNFYCHATYQHDSEMHLQSVQGLAFSDEGDPLRAEEKVFNLGTMNEISHAILELAGLNEKLWALVPRIEAVLGVRRVAYPPQTASVLSSSETHPPTSESAPQPLPDQPSEA